MPKRLARVHVREVYLDERDRDRRERVRSAMLVCVSAAGLITMNAMPSFAAACTGSISAPSEFDWKLASSWPDSRAIATRSASIAASVVRP